MRADIPVMVLVGQQAMHSFSLNEVQIDDTFEKLLDYFGPKSWNEDSKNVTVKISNTRNGSYDRFNI